MSTRQMNQTAGPLVVTEPRPPFAVRWLRPPVLVALLVGALLGALFGSVMGNVGETNNAKDSFTPFGGIGGTLLGLLAGLSFVVVGLLLYRFIRNALSGAIIMGLFAMVAMALVGGLYGAVVGVLAGAIFGALVGAVKAAGGLVVGNVSYPVPGAQAPPSVATADTMDGRAMPSREGREHTAAGDSRTAA